MPDMAWPSLCVSDNPVLDRLHLLGESWVRATGGGSTGVFGLYCT